MFIGIIGGNTCSASVARIAEDIGRMLAERGATVICGGLGGVMEAACKGARQAGGRTIGILPGNSAADANPYVEIPIVTGMSDARNVIIIKSSQAVIAIDGEFGTLSEIGHALRRGVPVVGLDTWSLAKEERGNASILVAENGAEAVEKALAAAGTGVHACGDKNR